ncbi:MAG: hypothetical protein KJ600_03755, partial [Nanoarchaeota archaeon]|nr:hypothetical protein [Nanoarchaeota archaeon]
MVTKRYIKKGGKTYGPYFYESYRDRDGNVKKRYIKDYKPSSQQNKLKISFAIIAVIAVSFLFYSFLISEATKTLTGKAVFLEKKVYSPGERLNGEILLNVKSGELIPKDVKVTINLGSTKEEFILSEFVDFTLTEGEFFAENSDLKGTGLGYGEAGTKTTHPTINFELEIYETSQESGGDSDDVEYSPSTEDEADTIGNEEEVTEDEGNTEESESSTESETPEEVTEPEETSESPITGEVISEPENKIIGGQASYENDFTYTLEPNQKARIVPDSVNIDDEQISNSELSLKIENNQVVVSTAYSTTEKGFGADFIGEDVALTFKINVADLELAASPGELEVKLSYKNKEIAFYSETIHVSEIEISLNETNKTEEQIEILTLLKEIPSIRIPSGQSTTLNLKEYFENAESYEIIVESITTKIEEHILELIPEPDFSGAKKTKLIAQSGEQTLESNEFMILVSSGAVDIKTSRKQIRLGETVKWKTEVYKGNPEESLSIEIPKDAENLNIKKLKDGIVIEDENLKVGITGNSILTGDVIIEVNLKKEEENAIVKKLKSWMANLKSRITKQLGITGKSISSEEIVEDETVDVVLEDSVAEEYLIEYETPPPRSTETETKDGKLITITGPDSVEYTDVIAFTELDNTIKVSEDKIKLYWRNYEYEQLGEEEIIEAVTKEVKDVPEEEIVEEISLNENNETNSSSNILTGNVISAESSLGENTLASEQRTEQNYIKQAVLFDAYDLDFDGFIDYVEWVVPHLSNQTYEIIIEITNAEHLDESRAFISNIYDEVKALDDNWSETIPENHYTRVVFESNLTSTNDITLFPRIISGAPRIEIYEKNQTQKIAEFSSLNENQYNQVYLTNLQGVQDTFDLLILDGAVQFDHIIDPTIEGPPIITIVAPLNNSNLDTENPDFNVSLNEDGSWCGFSVDGAANITLTAFNSTYFFDNRTLKAGFSDGSHSVVFSCNDTDGEMGTSEGSYFLIDTTNPAINFTNPTPSNNTVVTTAFINVSSSDANAHYTFLDIDNDLVLWMRMDDTNASGDPTDLSSYSNNGSKQGNAAQTSVGY